MLPDNHLLHGTQGSKDIIVGVACLEVALHQSETLLYCVALHYIIVTSWYKLGHAVCTMQCKPGHAELKVNAAGKASKVFHTYAMYLMVHDLCDLPHICHVPRSMLAARL